MTRVLILYHYFYPDDVVSARLFTQLAESLVSAGMDVDVLTSNRSCHQPDVRFSGREKHNGINIFRVKRPFSARTNLIVRGFGVLALLANWAARCCFLVFNKNYDAVIVGTDPPMGYMLAPLLKKIQRRSKIFLWSFDLYPQALVASGKLNKNGLFYSFLTRIAKVGYRSIDHIFSIGSCMTNAIRLAGYKGTVTSCVPWSIVESSPDPMSDSGFLGSDRGLSDIQFLYSGTLGSAHAVEPLLELAAIQKSWKFNVMVCGRGNHMNVLQAEVNKRGLPIHFAGFVPEAELTKRLTAAHVHIVTLEPEWLGVVVPSKFFTALALGRPVLFLGPPESAVAHWIAENRVGWTATNDLSSTLEKVGLDLSDRKQREEISQRCKETYFQQFSREICIRHFLKYLGHAAERI